VIGSLDEKSRLMPNMILEMERKGQDTLKYRQELVWIWSTYPALIREKSNVLVQLEGLLCCLRRNQEYKECIGIGKCILALLETPDTSVTQFCETNPLAEHTIGSVQVRAVCTMVRVARYLTWETDFKDAFVLTVQALENLRERCDYRCQMPGTLLYCASER
jgi:hypothetical protein